MNTLKQLYASFLLILAINREALQRKLAGGFGRRLEEQLSSTEKQLSSAIYHNRDIVSVNLQLRRALAGVNKRGVEGALILGRTQFGEITRDTATTFDTVYLPTVDVTITVRGEEVLLSSASDDDVLTISKYDPVEGAPGHYRKLAIRR